jgi:ligand-binding sensor domain-containing protein
MKKGSGYYMVSYIPVGLLTGVAFTLVFGPTAGAIVFVAYVALGALPSPVNVTKVYVDSKNNIWLSAQPKGVFMTDGKNWMEYNTKNGLPNKRVNDFMESSDGDMWFGTSGGIAIMKK